MKYSFLFSGDVFDDAVRNYMEMDRAMGAWRSPLSNHDVFSSIWIVPFKFHIDLYQRR